MKLAIKVDTVSSLPPHTLRKVYKDIDMKELAWQIDEAVEKAIGTALAKHGIRPETIWVDHGSVKVERVTPVRKSKGAKKP